MTSHPFPLATMSLTFVLSTTAAVGCARWSDPPSAPAATLPAVGENGRSVVLQVEFLPIRGEQSESEEQDSLWQWVDETVIDPSIRRRLTDNGLRAGRVINIERFRRRMELLKPKQDVVDQFLTDAAVASEVSHDRRRIPMRLGRRYELPLHQPIRGQQVALVRFDDQTIGKTVRDPQYLFAMQAAAGKQAGQISLRLRPEVQHGEMKHKWVSSDSALRIDARRESWSINQLDLVFHGGEDDVFVVAATEPPLGLASQMLVGETPDRSVQRMVVLIRLAQIPTPAEKL